MNSFQYALRVKEFETLKTKKAKLAFIRTIHRVIIGDSSWAVSTYCSSEDFYELANMYKIYKVALDNFEGDLSIFLTQTCDNLRESVLEYAIGQNIPKKDVEDAMQFEVMTPSNLSYKHLQSFLTSAMASGNILPISSKLHIMDIVRNSLEPSTL